VSSPSGTPQLAAVARLAALTQRMPLLPGSDEHVFGHRIAAAARYTNSGVVLGQGVGRQVGTGSKKDCLRE
jgi:hypothetical protein